MVSGSQVIDILTDAFDYSSPLVPHDDRSGNGHVALHDVEVAVANAGSVNLDPHFVASWILNVEFLDSKRGSGAAEDSGACDHFRLHRGSGLEELQDVGSKMLFALVI